MNEQERIAKAAGVILCYRCRSEIWLHDLLDELDAALEAEQVPSEAKLAAAQEHLGLANKLLAAREHARLSDETLEIATGLLREWWDSGRLSCGDGSYLAWYDSFTKRVSEFLGVKK